MTIFTQLRTTCWSSLTNSSSKQTKAGTGPALSYLYPLLRQSSRSSVCTYYPSHRGKGRCGPLWSGCVPVRGWPPVGRLRPEAPGRVRGIRRGCTACVRPVLPLADAGGLPLLPGFPYVPAHRTGNGWSHA